VFPRTQVLFEKLLYCHRLILLYLPFCYFTSKSFRCFRVWAKNATSCHDSELLCCQHISFPKL